MRFVDLALAAPLATGLFAPFATAQSDQERSSLRDEIRQIVREEIRAALREAHSGATAASPTEKTKPGKKSSDHVIHLGQGHVVNDNDGKLGELSVEMDNLNDLLGNLEIVVDGDKVEAKRGDAKAKTKVKKLKSANGDEGTMVFEVVGDDDDKDEAKKPQGMTFSFGEAKGGDAKKAKVKKVKSDDGEEGAMVFQVVGDDDDQGEATEPHTRVFAIREGKSGAIELHGDAKTKKTKVKKVKSDDGDDKGEGQKPMTFSFTEPSVIEGQTGTFEFTPMTQVKKAGKAKAAGEGKTMAFRLRCEDGKCTLEPIDGTGDGGVFVISTDSGDGNGKVKVVGGKKGEVKSDCCSGDSCCDTKTEATTVEGQPLTIRFAEPMEIKLDTMTEVTPVEVQPLKIRLAEPMEIKLDNDALRVDDIKVDDIKVEGVKVDTKPIRVRRLQNEPARDSRNI